MAGAHVAVVDHAFDDLRGPVRRDGALRPPKYKPHPKHLSVVELRLAEVHLGVTTYPAPVRALIIGENPGKRTHPHLPLFPWPATSSAGRLLEMSGLTAPQYLGHLYRRNLCDTQDEFDHDDAQERAREILTALFDMPKDLRVVLCGQKVARAFEVHGFWVRTRLETRHHVVAIPHPSGMNRIYNEWKARETTREWLRWAALGEQEPRE